MCCRVEPMPCAVVSSVLSCWAHVMYCRIGPCCVGPVSCTTVLGSCHVQSGRAHVMYCHVGPMLCTVIIEGDIVIVTALGGCSTQLRYAHYVGSAVFVKH